MSMNFLTLGQDRPSEVTRAWLSGDENYLADVLSKIRNKSSPFFESLSELTEILRETSSPRVRAAVAMALADIDDKEAITPLIDVLRRPEIARSSGTLLFALNELGAHIPLSVFVGLVENGSFEGRAEALTFMEEGRIAPFSDAEESDAKQRLAKLAESEDAETAEAAKLALDYLGGYVDRAK